MRRLPEMVHVVYVTSKDKDSELDVYFTCKPVGQYKYFKTSKSGTMNLTRPGKVMVTSLQMGPFS